MSQYRLIDSGNFKKLEQVGDFKIIRPAPAAVWSPFNSDDWKDADGEFFRFSDGNGNWKWKKQELTEQELNFTNFSLEARPTRFGHLGLFAEQSKNWKRLHNLIKSLSQNLKIKAREGRRISHTSTTKQRRDLNFEIGSKSNFKNNEQEVKVLNLFAYTGGSTLACASAGASVVHLDASKTSVDWARDNCNLSNLSESAVRWIVDDVQTFVSREVRRNSTYHGIILDPPSFGRGSKKQVWKIEDHLIPLLENLFQILNKEKFFVLLSSHSAGYTPLALKNLLLDVNKFGKCNFFGEEMVIFDKSERPLPSGSCCWALSSNLSNTEFLN